MTKDKASASKKKTEDDEESADVEIATVKKKKKKRKYEEIENIDLNEHSQKDGFLFKKSKKEKRKKSADLNDKDHGELSEEVRREKSLDDHQDINLKSKKKNKHRKSEIKQSHKLSNASHQNKNAESQHCGANVTDFSKAEKHKKKKRKLSERDQFLEADQNSDFTGGDHKSKSRKTFDKETGDSPNQNLCVNKKHKKMKRGKEKTDDETYHERLENDNSEDKIVKKKKKKKKEKDRHKAGISEENTIENEHLVTYEDKLVKKKKKKKDQHKEGISEENTIENEYLVTYEDKLVKKKKKKDMENKTDRIQEDMHSNLCRDNKKKKLKSVEVKEEQEDIKKDTEHTGQWSTAFNGNKDKQNKFLRLLGGFKKGTDDNSAKVKTFSSKFTNFAMDQSTEKNYEKSLENQYEKAMATNLQRGIGLGFQPPPDAGKKFYIDKGVSKSIKFDD